MRSRRSLSRDRAVAFWRRVADGVAAGGRAPLVAEDADGDAARLYARLGRVRVGDVPDYAQFPNGGPCGTTYFYRRLDG